VRRLSGPQAERRQSLVECVVALSAGPANAGQLAEFGCEGVEVAPAGESQDNGSGVASIRDGYFAVDLDAPHRPALSGARGKNRAQHAAAIEVVQVSAGLERRDRLNSRTSGGRPTVIR
jgi:hypothetical protein